MKIEPKTVTLAEVHEGYADDGEGGVRGYGGALDIRPPYQREFVYDVKKRNAVMETVWRDFPLNGMYWAHTPGSGYEVIDGQQRTLSAMQFMSGDFSMPFEGRGAEAGFHNLQHDEQARIGDYGLQVYVCTGTASEYLEWFKRINIQGEPLTPQELRNAFYHGPWLATAKKSFSQSNCRAAGLARGYVKGNPLRQGLLETAIKWKIHGTGQSIERYMAQHQGDKNADDLWSHFRDVIDRAKSVFPHERKELASVPWGEYYAELQDPGLAADVLEAEVKRLMLDDDVRRKAGIYPYLLTHDKPHREREQYLDIRKFTPAMIAAAWERSEGKCSMCGKDGLRQKDMDADHITPWRKGGKTEPDNCQMLCIRCNRGD